MGIDELAELSAQCSRAGARREKIKLLSACLRQVSPVELPLAVKFLRGELTQGRIGLGPAVLRRVLASCDDTPARGEQADELTLSEVDAVFGRIAAAQGKGSQARRVELLHGLLAKTTAAGRGFLAKLVLGELRQGALEAVLVEAIADAMQTPKEDVRRAVMLTGDLARVAVAAQVHGAAGVRSFSIELFRPLQPMLAEPADDMEQALQRLGRAAIEYKLDGVRVQVHKSGDRVGVFTRHLKEVTANVPEVVKLVRRLPMDDAILDGEVLALRADGRPHPFQTTMRRFGRTHEIDAMRDALPLSVLFFDCLLVNRQSLIDQPTEERRSALQDCLPHDLLIPRLVTDAPGQAREFLESALRAGHEGVMAKSLEAAYAAGGRGQSWLKIKPAHTLDLVILAAEWGSGRRRGWLSNLHLGARVAGTNEFAMIGKTFKGLTDEMLTWQTEQFLQLETHRDKFTVYVPPVVVAEIAFNEVQRSRQYDSGYALRFARVKRYRHDKPPTEADTLDAVARIFERGR